MLEAFIQHLEERKSADATVAAYAADLRQFEAFAAEHGTDVEGATPDLVVSFLATITRPATRARKIAALRGFYGFLVVRGVIATTPMADIARPAIRRAIPMILTEHEVQQMIDLPSLSLRDRAILALLYAGGLRTSEVARLDVSDLDLDGATIAARGRVILLSADALDALTAYLVQDRPYRGVRADTGAVFVNYTGRRISRQLVWNVVTWTARRALLPPGITPATLRHSLAAHLLERGFGFEVVRELLGHADLSTTAIYRQALNERRASGAGSLLAA